MMKAENFTISKALMSALKSVYFEITYLNIPQTSKNPEETEQSERESVFNLFLFRSCFIASILESV